MGVGKTTVGRLLASRTALPFWDTDQAVVEMAGQSIADIFATDGEPRFRELETRAIFNLKLPAVVALGGGSLGAPENYARVKKSGRLVYLRAKLPTLSARLENSAESRPLILGLSASERAQKIAWLFETRQAIYQMAEFKIDTDGKDPAAVAEQILRELPRNAQ